MSYFEPSVLFIAVRPIEFALFCVYVVLGTEFVRLQIRNGLWSLLGLQLNFIFSF